MIRRLEWTPLSLADLSFATDSPLKRNRVFYGQLAACNRSEADRETEREGDRERGRCVVLCSVLSELSVLPVLTVLSVLCCVLSTVLSVLCCVLREREGESARQRVTDKGERVTDRTSSGSSSGERTRCLQPICQATFSCGTL